MFLGLGLESHIHGITSTKQSTTSHYIHKLQGLPDSNQAAYHLLHSHRIARFAEL